MFPWVYGFHWSAGYIIFLGLFMAVAAAAAGWFAQALLRTRRTFASGRSGALMWESVFHDLPAAERVCRHQLAGEMDRTCPNGFDCRSCETHGRLLERGTVSGAQPGGAGASEFVAGLTFPLDRYYHRGHTWVRRDADGSLRIGLDALGRRFAAGKPELPPVGARLEVNGLAWRCRSGNGGMRVLSPVEGVVAAHGGADDDWVLRVEPSGTFDATHLLRGEEVRPWVLHELARIGLFAGAPGLGATLPDGGAIVDDPERELGSAAAAMREELFYEP